MFHDTQKTHKTDHKNFTDPVLHSAVTLAPNKIPSLMIYLPLMISGRLPHDFSIKKKTHKRHCWKLEKILASIFFYIWTVFQDSCSFSFYCFTMFDHFDIRLQIHNENITDTNNFVSEWMNKWVSVYNQASQMSGMRAVQIYYFGTETSALSTGHQCTELIQF